MGPAPSKKHTLDRINPYKGYGWQPHEDGTIKLNCRWATPTEQMNNLKRHWKKPEEADQIAKLDDFNTDVDSGDDDE